MAIEFAISWQLLDHHHMAVHSEYTSYFCPLTIHVAVVFALGWKMHSLTIYFLIFYSHLHNTLMAGFPLLVVAMRYTQLPQMSFLVSFPVS